jgi:hypothetical protein
MTGFPPGGMPGLAGFWEELFGDTHENPHEPKKLIPYGKSTYSPGTSL